MYATVSELKELKEWLLGGCKDINEQPRTELEKEIKRLNHIVSNKASDIKKLKQSNQALIYQLNQSKAIVTRLETETINLKEVISIKDILEIEVKNLKTENTELIRKLEKKRAAETVLEDRIKQLFSSDNAHKSEKQKLQSINRELEKVIINKFKDEIKDLKNTELNKNLEIEKLEESITYWKSQYEELQEQKNYFENEYYRLVRENNELKEKNKSLLKDNITIVTDIELVEKLNKALEQSEETLFKKNQELITANQILKKSVDELTDVISLKERDIKDLVDKNNELKNELEQARKSSYIQGTTKEIFTMPQDKVREYNEKIKRDNYPEDYTYKLDNNDLDINNSIGTIYGNPLNLELQRECIELKDDLKLKTAELNTYIAEYESLEQKKINLEVDLEEQKSLVNTTRKLWEKLEKENGNLKNKVIELQANLIEAKKLLEDSLLTIESLESTIKDLKKDNSNLKEVNNKMFQSNEKLSKEIENLNLENSKVWNRNRELEDTNKKFIDLNTNLEKELLKTKQLLDIELNKNIPF